MASEDSVSATNEGGEGRDTHTSALVFLVPTLDTPQQREEVIAKIQDFITCENLGTCGQLTYVGQAGWEETGQVWSLTSHVMSTCRRHQVLASERCVLLSLHDQYQAIQLCLARINKVRRGEFMAAASDVLDAWNEIYKETVTVDPKEAEMEGLEELNHLHADQESCDPMRRELHEVIKDYREFLANSLCVDHFKVFECLRTLRSDNPTLFRDMFAKTYIIEGLEQLPLMERELLKLISEGSQMYRVTTELPFLNAAPPSPSTFDISGIHETSILQTPSRQSKQDQTESKTSDSKDVNSQQTPDEQVTSNEGSVGDDANNTSQSKQDMGKTESMESDTKDANSQERVEQEGERLTEETENMETEQKDTDSQEKAIIQEAKEGQYLGETDSMETEQKDTDSQVKAIIQETKEGEYLGETEQKDTDSQEKATIQEAKVGEYLGETDSMETNTKDTNEEEKLITQDEQQTDEKESRESNTKELNREERTIIRVERVDETPKDLIDAAPHYPPKSSMRNESDEYIERLFLAHLRLLVNTRDELALTLACSMPGREITHQGFTDIRQEAQKKEMPMYQTIMSFILRQRLGGKGYQLEPNNPVLLHSRPLGEFVDALIKLQNILEGQTDSRQGAMRVVNGIKTSLQKMKGCTLKRSLIETVSERLSGALKHLMEAMEGDNASAKKSSSGSNKPSNLHPSLRYLIRLCDVAGGQTYTGGVVDALGGDLLTQLSSSKKGPQTPLRVPSVLNLFRSPEEVEVGKTTENGEFEDEGDLLIKLKRKMDKTTTAPAQPKRYKSECSWAPIDLSPIDADKLIVSASPIAGPSLMVAGRTTQTPKTWKETMTSTTQREDTSTTPSCKNTSPAKASSPAAKKGSKGDKPKTKSRRSLLKDISNLSKNEETQGKKKVSEGKKEGSKGRKEKTKPLLKGQRSITSFFRS